jgi:broad specificity phosphatase PhoE
MRLVLVRHGETEHNRGGLTLGRHDVPLNAKGLLQAAAVASSFPRPPEAIYTSPLRRASAIAEAIAARTGLEAAIDPDLVEMDVGEMEHLSRDDLRARYPDFLKLWRSGDVERARMPGGETLGEVQDRAWAAVERLRQRHPEGVVVAVTHNFVIATIVCRAVGLPLARFRRVRIALAGKSVLDMREDGAALIQLNDAAHLLAVGLAGDPATTEAR